MHRIPIIAAVFLSALLLLNYLAAFPQSPAGYQPYFKTYTEKTAIILNHSENIEVTFENGKLIYKSHEISENLFLNDKEQGYADEEIYSGFNNQVKNIHAYYYKPEGDKYKRFTVDNITSSDYLDNNIFFSDSKQSKIIFPRMEAGFRTSLSYDRKVLDPHQVQFFFFQSYIPAVKTEISVTFPEGVVIKYIIFNDDSNKIKFSEKKLKNKTVYTWSVESMPEFEIESDAPSLRHYAPHIIVYIEKYNYRGVENNLFTGINDLYSWYYRLVKDVSKDTSRSIKLTVDSLITNTPDTFERIRKIYHWVQDNINYVAFEDSMSGLIPSKARDVLNKRYGDCKGMANLLKNMLDCAGIPANLTWVGTRDLPYTYSQVYLPVTDNHMITIIKFHGKNIVLDATSKYNPVSLPSSFIQGKEALIGLGENKYEIYNIPVIGKDVNSCLDSCTVRFDGKKLHGEGTMIMKGFLRVFTVPQLTGLTGDKLSNKISDFTEKGNNKYKLVDFKISGTDNNDTSLVFRHSFDIPDYVSEIGSNLYVNLNLDKIYNNYLIDLKKKKYAMSFSCRVTYNMVYRFEIPDNYTIESIPHDTFRYNSDHFGFQTSYQVSGKYITLIHHFYINVLEINKPEFVEWNNMINKLSTAYKQVITLSKK